MSILEKAQIRGTGLLVNAPSGIPSRTQAPFSILQSDPKLPLFPKYELAELVAFADAAYAMETKTKRSVTSYVIVFGGASVAYKAKLQATIATSSTKAEFIAAVYTAKAVKHL